jgi:hypothetical protein
VQTLGHSAYEMRRSVRLQWSVARVNDGLEGGPTSSTLRQSVSFTSIYLTK